MRRTYIDDSPGVGLVLGGGSYVGICWFSMHVRTTEGVLYAMYVLTYVRQYLL